ncbi:MAG: hypothetical protein LBC02_11120 [Planctomycetaceae bacterium]|jgi:hypothetical protein|nr:hypothetical protein [Planctomycetaceae bacterium]
MNNRRWSAAEPPDQLPLPIQAALAAALSVLHASIMSPLARLEIKNENSTEILRKFGFRYKRDFRDNKDMINSCYAESQFFPKYDYFHLGVFTHDFALLRRSFP